MQRFLRASPQSREAIRAERVYREPNVKARLYTTTIDGLAAVGVHVVAKTGRVRVNAPILRRRSIFVEFIRKTSTSAASGSCYGPTRSANRTKTAKPVSHQRRHTRANLLKDLQILGNEAPPSKRIICGKPVKNCERLGRLRQQLSNWRRACSTILSCCLQPT